MSTFFLDTRELRSFRLKYHTNKLSAKLKNQTCVTGICVTDAFDPIDRQNWREHPIHQELKIIAIPNQIGRFLFKDKANLWHNVRNLFKCQLFLIESKTKQNLTLKTLNQFLSLKKFSLRILFAQDQLYRSNTIIAKMTVPFSDKDALVSLVIYLKSQLINVMLLNTLPMVIKQGK
jgi:hypothetical protein